MLQTEFPGKAPSAPGWGAGSEVILPAVTHLKPMTGTNGLVWLQHSLVFLKRLCRESQRHFIYFFFFGWKIKTETFAPVQTNHSRFELANFTVFSSPPDGCLYQCQLPPRRKWSDGGLVYLLCNRVLWQQRASHKQNLYRPCLVIFVLQWFVISHRRLNVPVNAYRVSNH